MGGAKSTDKAYRKEHVSWWEEEIPSTAEMEHAAATLETHNFKVDYIISHCAPNFLVDKLYPYDKPHDPITNFLEKYVRENTTFAAWFLGHYHVDRSTEDRKYNILYHDILEIMPNGEWELVG